MLNKTHIVHFGEIHWVLPKYNTKVGKVLMSSTDSALDER
jgi:hypothetical protein